MSESIENLWAKYCSSLIEVDQTHVDPADREFSFPLRKGSSFKKAEPYVFGRSSPSLPVKMLAVREIHDGFRMGGGIKIAKEYLRDDPTLTMRELGYLMLKSKNMPYPYIWWCQETNTQKRAIYEDSEGLNFVKLSNKWQMVYSTMSAGILVGAQGRRHHEDVPRNSYFILWDNEEMARQHAT